uniref:Uncharacterized protein n=1 Tax=Salix viminalis TaxID=40686 RepID=A0A6N2MNX9_SALVM
MECGWCFGPVAAAAKRREEQRGEWWSCHVAAVGAAITVGGEQEDEAGEKKLRVHPAKMDTNDKNMEPVIDLGFSLGYSNQCIQRRLKNDSGPGAGANAASSVDMTFVATNALSELVWSPKKGLSLKCADGTFSQQTTPSVMGCGIK